MNKLLLQRKAYKFRMHLYGLFNLIEGWIKELSDPACEWTSDNLMYIHFNQDFDMISSFMADPDCVDALARCYPGEVDELVEAAEDLMAVLPALHNVRQSVLVPHIRPDGKDIHREHFCIQGVPSARLEDRALINGLTPRQQAALEANLCPRGYTKLSGAERQALLTAFTEVLTDTR